MRISDWSSDVCSSDLIRCGRLTDRNKCGEVRHHSHPCALILLNGSGGSMTAQSAAERGAHADTPASLTIAAWREIAGRIWVNSGRHNINLIDRTSSVEGTGV